MISNTTLSQGLAFARGMDASSENLTRQEVVKDPALLAAGNVELHNNIFGWEMFAQLQKTLHREDQQLVELLRDI